MKDYQPTGPLASVTAESVDDVWTLVFVRDFGHPVPVVWRALTEPDQLDQWAPFRADRDLAALGEATLTMIDGESEVALPVTVTAVDPPTRLEYSWGTDRLGWHLAATDAGTAEASISAATKSSFVAAGGRTARSNAPLCPSQPRTDRL